MSSAQLDLIAHAALLGVLCAGLLGSLVLALAAWRQRHDTALAVFLTLIVLFAAAVARNVWWLP